MDYPHLNICFDVDITATRSYAKDQGLKLSNLILYFSTYAANQIPEMKTRIRDDQVVDAILFSGSSWTGRRISCGPFFRYLSGDAQ